MTAFEDGTASLSSPAQWITLVSHGARLGVCASDPLVLSGFERRLPFGSRVESSGWSREAPASLDAVFTLAGEAESSNGSPGSAPAAHRLYLDSDLLQASRDLGELYARLESELHFSVASHARSVLFVHAGVVAWRGRGVLLPGRSMAGKTSLVTALLRAGAEYYSDEYAVVDEQGRVHPYPRPLGVRAPDGTTRSVSPQSLGCSVGSAPLDTVLVVKTHYSSGARFEPLEASAAGGLMTLIENTVVVRERSSFALDRLTPLARGAIFVAGRRGEADAAASWILRFLDAAPGRAVE